MHAVQAEWAWARCGNGRARSAGTWLSSRPCWAALGWPPPCPSAPASDRAAVIRVLVADDHPLFRYGLRASLESVPGIEVVGEAINGRSAVALAHSLHPDVVVMDLSMPGL